MASNDADDLEGFNMHRYRITLTTGAKSGCVLRLNNMEARRIAHRECPGLQLFGVYVERVERIETA